MSDKKFPAGMADDADWDAELESMYDASLLSDGAVDTEDDGAFVLLIEDRLKQKAVARNWRTEAVAQKRKFLDRRKYKREPSQPALIGPDYIYSLGKVKNKEGRARNQVVRASDMSVRQASLFVAFREKFRDEVIIDTALDTAPFREIIRASTDPDESVMPIAEKLRLTLPKRMPPPPPRKDPDGQQPPAD